MGMQQKTTAADISANTTLGGHRAKGLFQQTARQQQLRRRAQEGNGQRHHYDDFDEPIIKHGLPPARVRDRALEDRRPDRPREVAAARDQRERRAAAAVEPAAHIDIERRVHAADAEETHEQRLAEVELPTRAAGRERKAHRDHQRTENDGPAHPDAFGDDAHDDAAGAIADPGQRTRQGRYRAQAAGFRGNRLERDNRDPGRAERQRQDHQRDRRDHPGRFGFDRLHGEDVKWLWITAWMKPG